jgi:hypothetical protein
MKFAGKQVRFSFPHLAWPGRRRLRFVGRRASVQVLETALVMEGYLMRLSLPVLDYFFKTALSEWTTITVPYSRIVRFRRVRALLLLRLLVCGLLWVPGVLMLIGAGFQAYHGGPELAGNLCAGLLCSLPALLVTWFVNFRRAPRYELLFRRADGGLSIVYIRVKPRKLGLAFGARVEENRRAAAAFRGGEA